MSRFNPFLTLLALSVGVGLSLPAGAVDSHFDPVTVEAVTAAAYREDADALASRWASARGYTRAYAGYRYAQLSFRGDSEVDLRSVLRKAEEAIAGNTHVEAQVLRAAIYSLLMGVEPNLAARLMIETHTLVDGVSAHSAAKGRALLVKGVMVYHTPVAYGGGLQRAEPLLLAALEHFDGNPDAAVGWGLAETLAWLGKLYTAQNKPAAAERHFTAASDAYPGFDWFQ